MLWFHGLSVDKETHRKELERIAAAGFLAVGVDAAGHGERRLPDLDARIGVSREETIRFMLGLVEETAREVPGIVRALVAEGLADAERVALVGISMGGYVVYRALLEEQPVRRRWRSSAPRSGRVRTARITAWTRSAGRRSSRSRRRTTATCRRGPRASSTAGSANRSGRATWSSREPCT